MKRSTASKLWSGWVTFGCTLEAYAFLKGEDGATLSANVWDVFHIKRRDTLNHKISKAITIGFITWLPIHWITGGKV